MTFTRVGGHLENQRLSSSRQMVAPNADNVSYQGGTF
jgi:hypothetical protein